MARKRPDPRVTRYAIPPLARVRGKHSQRELALHVATHHCDKCELPPIVSETRDGRIIRRCLRHLTSQGVPVITASTGKSLRDSGYWAAQ